MSDLKGTNIAARIVPFTEEDTYATHDSLYGKGGYREVATVEERDALPEERLRAGCKVHVVSEGKEYFYKGGGAWVEANDYLPTGTTEDGTPIRTFEDLLGFIRMSSGEGDKVQRNVRIVNNLESKNLAASKGEPCVLRFTFVSQERYSFSEPYQNTGERGLCQISVKTADGAAYTVVKQMYVNSASPVTVDVSEFLTSGANNVMVKVTGEVTETATPAFVYTVQLTSLSVSAANFRWWTAYAGDIVLPLNIGGNVSKVLFVSLTGEDYSQSYEVPLGTNIYVETAYNYTIPHPAKTGIFHLSAYVANADGSIRTRSVAFNIICLVAGEQVKLMAINNVLPKATNWTENALFDYTMYDSGNVSASARFVVTKDGMEVFASAEDAIATSAKHTFSIPLEIETMDSSEFSLVASVLDGETELAQPLTFAVNNSLGYSAVAGAVFYLNPRTRSNRQDNRQVIINEMDATGVTASWKNMNWGNDGWQSDRDGNKLLRLMAGSSLSVDYYPFQKECARTGKTIEIDYRVDNVTDPSQPLLTLSSAAGDSFVGLKIFADDLVMHTQALKNSGVQSVHTFEGKRTRLTLVVMPDAYGNSRFNLCLLYIDGKKNREFTYENNDYFAHNGGIVVGSDYADVDVYGIRVYDSALTSQGVLRNYINWMVATDEKKKEAEANDVLDANGSEVDFENTKDQYNVMVFDNTIPRIADPSARIGTLELYFAGQPDRNVSITNVEAKGQGTSSMRYYLWNTKYAIDKTASVITYADGTIGKKTWQMVPGIPAAAKFTAKKNFASSMQSHKMGSVNSIQDLYKKMGFMNEAMATEQYAEARIAVYQLPFVCFEKSVNDDGETVYTFAGMYTFGPDKGDKYTFGYDTDLFPGLLSIEGSDNSPLATLFRVPWNHKMQYNADEEAFQYNGANAFDFDGGLETNIDRWIPAYNLVYACSPRLKPFDGTVDDLNAQIPALRTEPCEFWIARPEDANRFNVYYYDSADNRFVSSDTGSGTINLLTQLVDKGYGLTASDVAGKSADQLNALFIRARVAKFRQEAPAYWDITDAIFHRNWVELNAGTDNRAKNTYMYCFGEGCRWKWRYDDLDTIFDTDNEGQPEKEYGVELHDLNEHGAAVWNGETSNFWNLIDLAFPDEVTSEMKRMLTAMQALSGLKGGTDYDKLMAYYQKYYFSQAQEYFPANVYNADARVAYEYGKLAYLSGSYTNDTDPITQSLGDHYAAEQRWISKRMVYMMSKYSFGLFSAGGTDVIVVRAAGGHITYHLTPAIDLYPAIANGTSILRGARTKAGEVCEMVVELSGSGDQQNAIQAASYLQDIGDWHDKNVSGTMVVQGKMLREIRLGSQTEPVVISISALTVSNCVSLQKLVLSNISTLSGNLDLTACTHLKEVYAGGTSLAQIKLPAGGGLQRVEFSAYNQYLSLSNYPLLTNEGVGIGLCKGIITDFFIVDCPQIKPIPLLVDILNAQRTAGADHALKRIRVVGFNEYYENSAMLDVLAQLADGSYSGLSAEGLAGDDPYPVLDGTITINASYYEDSVAALREKFKRLNLVLTGTPYVRFKDPVVSQICATAYGDGIGCTREQIEKVTAMRNFINNKEITSFDEFEQFINVKSMLQQHFRYCTNLKSIKFPDNIDTIEYAVLNGCTSLEYVKFPQHATRMGGNVCENTNSLKSVVLPDGIKSINVAVFGSSGIEVIHLPDELLSLGGAALNKTQLSEVILPEKLTEIGSMCFWYINTLSRVICKPIVPPAMLGSDPFRGCPSDLKIYVPNESLNAYKTATYWSTVASKIRPMSELES